MDSSLDNVGQIHKKKIKTQLPDAVRIFATAVRELDSTEEIEATKINCKHPVPWQHGNRIANYMRIVRIRIIQT